jgi:hypothetical protein
LPHAARRIPGFPNKSYICSSIKSFNEDYLLYKITYNIPGIITELCKSFPQEVPHPVGNTGIYIFLDELAGSQIISINSVVKPYSRLFISRRLKEADEKIDQLNPRQKKELDFYLLDFRKEIENGTTGQRQNGAMAQTTFAKATVVKGRNGSKVQRERYAEICFIIRIHLFRLR